MSHEHDHDHHNDEQHRFHEPYPCDGVGHQHHHHEDGSCCCEHHAKEFHGIDRPMLIRLIVSAVLYLAGILYSSINISYASELAARRTAMEAATDNAEEMIDNLSLYYNRARQASITQEITEIVAGAES